jgi:hypothetical protein
MKYAPATPIFLSLPSAATTRQNRRDVIPNIFQKPSIASVNRKNRIPRKSTSNTMMIISLFDDAFSSEFIGWVEMVTFPVFDNQLILENEDNIRFKL